jgi:hypothetical protein
MTGSELNPGDQATIIGVGAAVLLAAGGGIWRAASLRGDLNARWRRRVDFAVARLDELIIAELRMLRDEVDTVLPEPQDFDPVLVLADPAPLSKRAAHVVKLYRTRQHMERDLARSRSVGIALITALSLICITSIYTLLQHHLSGGEIEAGTDAKESSGTV